MLHKVALHETDDYEWVFPSLPQSDGDAEGCDEVEIRDDEGDGDELLGNIHNDSPVEIVTIKSPPSRTRKQQFIRCKTAFVPILFILCSFLPACHYYRRVVQLDAQIDQLKASNSCPSIKTLEWAKAWEYFVKDFAPYIDNVPDKVASLDRLQSQAGQVLADSGNLMRSAVSKSIRAWNNTTAKMMDSQTLKDLKRERIFVGLVPIGPTIISKNSDESEW
eukprot:CAMPEP_0197236556 /NCGR_PEP_ID=MMETSP1429-20130617/3615_1 /TAXON_ID=49237 /ORGANISM="Chaetoceros  sp., Strain UNC1202" /LENGTH=219 /DNA_ID=CAMNT_0042695351 /DNA_START=209 /DNA_END=865 /DNA_ORIENTATION=+